MREQSLFIEALEKEDLAERGAFLDRICAADPALRERIARLLERHECAGSSRELNLPAIVVDMPAGERPGAAVGPYKLLEQIGEGGMGTVWLAEQSRPVRRLVAVKLVKPGMDSQQVVARFDAERQALALMDHPNIATVLDAGAAEDGRPYFAMELVKGVPITRYCDNLRLTPRQRLELFVPVCKAIQHAHQKGVIHRDLKPGNVLVAQYDDRPVPKVIDFGVAKAVGQPLTDQTLHTGFGAVIGTIEYMSPEQATFNQLDIDTRSDIYSLGALLYELLAGSPPFGRSEGGVLEMLRAIREQEPTLPSAKLSTAAGLPALAANRGTEPVRLTRLVRGELDWIVMKCLEKDRDRRYETADGLAADLVCYLADEVVSARPPSAGYRLSKFVHRNRGPVAASVALALSLAAGTGAVVAVQAKADRDRAAVATDRATREAWTTASVEAACREARERADEAWGVTGYPDRMQRATDAAVAAIRRADDSAADGTAGEAALADLASTRQAIDDLARHTLLITACFAHREKYLDERTSEDLCRRHAESLRQFGLDPINGDADEVARAVAASRIRDSLLGLLLEWHESTAAHQKTEDSGPIAKQRIGKVIRAARQTCGGAYARWQDLIDRNDIPGLVAFAGSPEGLSFRSTLVAALGRDLINTKQYTACQQFLRAAVDRYPNDVWLHQDLSLVCSQVQPPAFAEAVRHMSAAIVLRPDNSFFHTALGNNYLQLGSYDQAEAACLKAIALSPASFSAYEGLGSALVRKKDWDGAIAAFRESILLNSLNPRGQLGLVTSLMGAGRHSEAVQAVLAAMRQNPPWVNQPGLQLRYTAARAAMKCADGKGALPLPPTERAAFRKQALDFLTAELAAFRKFAGATRGYVHDNMQRWLENEDLASVREPAALGQLPPEERDAWNKLWADVRDLRDRADPEKEKK